jgi:hypothetical protein
VERAFQQGADVVVVAAEVCAAGLVERIDVREWASSDGIPAAERVCDLARERPRLRSKTAICLFAEADSPRITGVRR